jgi:hypothetical protein
VRDVIAIRFFDWLAAGQVSFGENERMTWAFVRRIGVGRWLTYLLLTAPVGIAVAYRPLLDRRAERSS